MTLTASEIAGMRSVATSALPDTATIERVTTTNVGGEESETWTTLPTVACRIAPVGGGETGETGGRIAVETTSIVTLPAATDIEESDRIVIASRVYQITRVDKRGEWEISRRVQVKESV